mgnify:CR=1 FL=1
MRYVTKLANPKSSQWDEEFGRTVHTHDTIMVSDYEPEWTGLLDQHGNELYRVDRVPCGFGRR